MFQFLPWLAGLFSSGAGAAGAAGAASAITPSLAATLPHVAVPGAALTTAGAGSVPGIAAGSAGMLGGLLGSGSGLNPFSVPPGTSPELAKWMQQRAMMTGLSGMLVAGSRSNNPAEVAGQTLAAGMAGSNAAYDRQRSNAYYDYLAKKSAEKETLPPQSLAHMMGWMDQAAPPPMPDASPGAIDWMRIFSNQVNRGY